MGGNKAKKLLEDSGRYTDVFPVQNASGHGIDLVGKRLDGKFDIFEMKTTGVGPDAFGNRKAISLTPRQADSDFFINDILTKKNIGDFGIDSDLADEILTNIGDKRVIDIFVDNGNFKTAFISIWN